MQTASFFIDDKALFGSYPTSETVVQLENMGVRHFVNLTINTEKKISPYTTQYSYIQYPIKDNNIPEHSIEFTSFIYKLCSIISNLPKGELIYIHCKGGHGRSGVVVSCIVALYFNITPRRALMHTRACHAERLEMRDIWRRIGSPQTGFQQKFVYDSFKTTYIDPTHPLALESDNVIVIKNVGVFTNALHALQKTSLSLDEIVRLRMEQYPELIKLLSDTFLTRLQCNCYRGQELQDTLVKLRHSYYKV